MVVTTFPPFPRVSLKAIKMSNLEMSKLISVEWQLETALLTPYYITFRHTPYSDFRSSNMVNTPIS